ncbi:MAG: hypothetical protein A3J48_04270 [Candidatus Doudnabacteria bacterium RIFCSPHIGHO2_02_FULL_46_11]|uniref:Cell division protein FtsL n=1 Tax=Candidatus Doudnabacteria bacterium RIFCSPHIGHO2_02_FULL_46_11 TaxID=1817832 RepID=A0A1F5P4B0_9BACT|nr:MAG: hypothetical protein A3J48_04270 [Candidatus Doudnabacteria bacterium RIFCSPHIGHO2_02_FULL_46_11]
MRRTKTKRKNNSRSLKFTIALAILGMAITVAANHTTSSSFQAREIQQKIEQLAEENEQLEFQATNLKSLQMLSNSFAGQNGMVKVEDLRHITPAKEAEATQRAGIRTNP